MSPRLIQAYLVALHPRETRADQEGRWAADRAALRTALGRGRAARQSPARGPQ